MTSANDFERDLSAWFHEDADQRVSPHLDDVLRRTRAERQRSAWSSLERWLPVQTTLRFAPAPRMAWLLLVLGLVVAFAVAAVAIGSRTQRLPSPFGVAGNGSIAYGTTDGDIHAFDPTTGTSEPLIAAATFDETPFFSRDGSKVVFARRESALSWALWVANADGTNARALTGAIYPAAQDWSPDGSAIVVLDTAMGAPILAVYHLDGTAPTVLDIDGMTPDFLAWRPDGQEIVFRGMTPGRYGLYAVDVPSGNIRAIGPTDQATDALMDPQLSPDGTKVVYTRWVVDHPTIRIVDVDTAVDREIVYDGEVGLSGWVQAWSPDGTKLLFTRLADGPSHFAVGSVDAGPVTEIGPGWADSEVVAGFSPDGTKVIARYEREGSTWLLDLTGHDEDLLLPSTSYIGSWQRTAP